MLGTKAGNMGQCFLTRRKTQSWNISKHFEQRPTNETMSLQPKTKRIRWVFAIVLVVLIALGAWFTLTKFFREEKEVFASEDEDVKYGALGAEGGLGIANYL